MEQHGDLEPLNSFSFDIQDGHHGGHHESLQTKSAPELQVGLSWKMVGGVGGDMEINNC